MAHWVILIIFLNVPHFPQSVGANYDLQSIVVASVFNNSAIWMGNPFVAACSPRLSLPVLPKRKPSPLCRGLHKSENIGIGVFGILYRHIRLIKIKSLNEAALGYFWTGVE